MKQFYLALLAILTLFMALPLNSAPNQPACTAFVDVSVVPMDKDSVVRHQTVLIRGNRIARIAPVNRLHAPQNCLSIDGRRYLIPGLTDSHAHLPLAGAADQRLVLQLLLTNGITTAINMEGSPEILALRGQIERGEILGPKIYATGPFIQQPAFMTPEQVRQEVIYEKKAGYDFIKVHGDLTKEAYDALIEAAREQNIRVVGHVPGNLGIDAALNGHQSLIVHVEEYLYSYFQLPISSGLADRLGGSRSDGKRHSEKTADSGTWVSPTLSVFQQIISQAADIDAVLERPEMRYFPRYLTTGASVGATNFGWYPPDNPYVKRWPPERIPHLRAQYSVMQRLVRGLRDAGVPLLAGTDPSSPV